MIFAILSSFAGHPARERRSVLLLVQRQLEGQLRHLTSRSVGCLTSDYRMAYTSRLESILDFQTVWQCAIGKLAG